MNTATKDPPQGELEPRTPRSRILSLSTWAICDSTKAGGKKTLKYGRAHSASRAAVVWRWTWRSCSSLTVVYPLFSLKGRDNSLVQDNISTLNSSPSALTGENPRIKASAAPRLLIPSDLSPVKALGSEFNVYINRTDLFPFIKILSLPLCLGLGNSTRQDYRCQTNFRINNKEVFVNKKVSGLTQPFTACVFSTWYWWSWKKNIQINFFLPGSNFYVSVHHCRPSYCTIMQEVALCTLRPEDSRLWT